MLPPRLCAVTPIGTFSEYPDIKAHIVYGQSIKQNIFVRRETEEKWKPF